MTPQMSDMNVFVSAAGLKFVSGAIFEALLTCRGVTGATDCFSVISENKAGVCDA